MTTSMSDIINESRGFTRVDKYIKVNEDVSNPVDKENGLLNKMQETGLEDVYFTKHLEYSPEISFENDIVTVDVNTQNQLMPNLVIIEKFVNHVIKSKRFPFKLNTDSCGRTTAKKHMLYDKLPEIDLDSFTFITEYYFSERIELFRLAIEQYEGDIYSLRKLLLKNRVHRMFLTKEITLDYEVKQATNLNNFITLIRKIGDDINIKRKISLRKFNTKRNATSMGEYVNGLFYNYSRLLVVRVDLALSKSSPYDSLEDINKMFKRFLNSLRSNTKFKHLVGYIWKLEYGEKKGYHYHLLLFFNGSQVKDDFKYAQLTGEFWNETITRGEGTFYNCSVDRKKYKNIAIGIINYNDSILRQNLKVVINYLTKSEQHLMVRLTKKGRTLGRKDLLKIVTKRAGRPRKKLIMESVN